MNPNQERDQRTAAGRATRTDNGVPGACSCEGYPDLGQISNLPVQRLLKRLEEILEEESLVRPGEATKKLDEDLKALAKEYAGFTDLITKYEAFYDKIDCLLAEANRWNTGLREWCSANVDQETSAAIVKTWNDFYEGVENAACTRWIAARDNQRSQLDCLRQAERAADEAKDDFEAVKAFEKTVKERHTALGTLYKQGQTLNEAGQYRSVCAVSIEFCAAYNELGVLETWERKRQCGAPPETSEARGQQQSGRGESPRYRGGSPGSPCDATPEQDLKTYWTVRKYAEELNNRLRALILAKYVYFSWWQQRLELDKEAKRSKETLEKLQKSRQADFIREAADVEKEVVNA